ncbi:chitinase A, N-terminal domain protein, partial [Vibrio parahaemolyticus AQ3810]
TLLNGASMVVTTP